MRTWREVRNFAIQKFVATKQRQSICSN